MRKIRIQVVQRKFKSDNSYSQSYKICNCKYCCEGIKKLPNVDFYFQIAENTNNPIEDDNGYEQDLGVMLCNEVTYYDSWGYDDHGYTEEYYYKLEYCPICGEKIEVEIVNTVDVTEEYNILIKERDAIHKKCMSTDSKKKEAEYLEKRYELDRKIEDFYHTDTLPDKNREE